MRCVNLENCRECTKKQHTQTNICTWASQFFLNARIWAPAFARTGSWFRLQEASGRLAGLWDVKVISAIKFRGWQKEQTKKRGVVWRSPMKSANECSLENQQYLCNAVIWPMLRPIRPRHTLPIEWLVPLEPHTNPGAWRGQLASSWFLICLLLNVGCTITRPRE